MKVFIGWALLLSLPGLMFFPRAARAHDGWIEVTPAIVEKGQPVTVALLQGNHSNGHRSYRLAGKWDIEFTRVTVVAPSGKTSALAMIDLGEDPEKTGPKGPKGFHIGSFVAEEEGAYAVVARQERAAEGDAGKFRGVRFARAGFAALSTPTAAAARKIASGDAAARAEDALEIAPAANLLGVAAKTPVTLEVRYKGKPAAGAVVSVLRRTAGAAAALDLTADGAGRVTFTADAADFYLARAKLDEKSERGPGKFDLDSYEATYVFQVFNAR